MSNYAVLAQGFLSDGNVKGTFLASLALDTFSRTRFGAFVGIVPRLSRTPSVSLSTSRSIQSLYLLAVTAGKAVHTGLLAVTDAVALFIAVETFGSGLPEFLPLLFAILRGVSHL